MCVCLCVCLHLRLRAHQCARTRVCIRLRVSGHVCLCVRARAFVPAILHFRASVWVQRRCAGTLVARRGPPVFIARPATRGRPTRARCVGVGHRSVRLCARRRDVDEPYDQRAVGCAIFAHVRDRRCRRHLRHRRLRKHRQHRHHQRRMEEHRRRCAAGVSQGHSTGHLLRAPVGVPFGTPSAPLEYPSTSRVPQRTPWYTLGIPPIPR